MYIKGYFIRSIKFLHRINVSLTLVSTGGATPRNQIEPLAELLLALNRATWALAAGNLAAWLRAALAVNGFPTVHATDSHKQKFIAAVLKSVS